MPTEHFPSVPVSPTEVVYYNEFMYPAQGPTRYEYPAVPAIVSNNAAAQLNHNNKRPILSPTKSAKKMKTVFGTLCANIDCNEENASRAVMKAVHVEQMVSLKQGVVFLAVEVWTLRDSIQLQAAQTEELKSTIFALAAKVAENNRNTQRLFERKAKMECFYESLSRAFL